MGSSKSLPLAKILEKYFLFFVAFFTIFLYVCKVKFINKIIRTLRPLLQDYLPEAKKTEAAPKVEEAPEENVVPESKKNYEVLEDVLRHFSCQFEKEESDNFLIYTFDFQGGHFRVPVAKSGLPAAPIEFPYVHSETSEGLNALRVVCNEFNYTSTVSKYIYTFDEKLDEFAVHIFTPITLFDGNQAFYDYFEAVMNSQFALRRDFTERVEEMKRKQQSSDADMDEMYLRRINYLIYEQEITHQSESFQIRRTLGASFRLDDVLTLCFGLHDIDYVYLKIVRDEKVKLEFDVPTIRDWDIKANPADVNYYVYFNDPNGNKSQLRQAQIHLATEYDDDVATYIRVTAVLFPPAFNPNGVVLSGRSALADLTFIIAVDKVDEQKYRKEYDFIWKDALDKAQNDKYDEMTKEQAFLANAAVPDVGYYIYRGRRLFADKRYYEAIDYLSNVFYYMNDNYIDLSTKQKEAFNELCFILGFCYMELHFFTDAYFYLKIVSDENNAQFTKEYINCLVNSHDFRAHDVVNRWLMYVNDHIEQAENMEEDVNPALLDLKNFLRRRKVYLYINEERYLRAERICHEMLEEKENENFAIDELAYIQQIRRARGEVSPSIHDESGNFVDDLPF